ncbi:DUF1127 domain-containing protein [Roseibium sp. M-1]
MSDHSVPISRLRSGKQSSILRLIRPLHRWLRRRRDMAHLADLPDYLLADVGLSRENIRRPSNSVETRR